MDGEITVVDVGEVIVVVIVRNDGGGEGAVVKRLRSRWWATVLIWLGCSNNGSGRRGSRAQWSCDSVGGVETQLRKCKSSALCALDES